MALTARTLLVSIHIVLFPFLALCSACLCMSVPLHSFFNFFFSCRVIHNMSENNNEYSRQNFNVICVHNKWNIRNVQIHGMNSSFFFVSLNVITLHFVFFVSNFVWRIQWPCSIWMVWTSRRCSTLCAQKAITKIVYVFPNRGRLESKEKKKQNKCRLRWQIVRKMNALRIEPYVSRRRKDALSFGTSDTFYWNSILINFVRSAAAAHITRRWKEGELFSGLA